MFELSKGPFKADSYIKILDAPVFSRKKWDHIMFHVDYVDDLGDGEYKLIGRYVTTGANDYMASGDGNFFSVDVTEWEYTTKAKFDLLWRTQELRDA